MTRLLLLLIALALSGCEGLCAPNAAGKSVFCPEDPRLGAPGEASVTRDVHAVDRAANRSPRAVGARHAPAVQTA
jgi:hypothetical protein